MRLRGVPLVIMVVSIGVTVLIIYGIVYAYQRISLGTRRDQAARRGIEWLLTHTDTVSPSAAAWLLTDVYNVIDDDTIKQTLASIINEKHTAVSEGTISLSNNGQASTDENLYPMAERVFSRLCLGIDATNDLSTLTEFVRKMKSSDNLGFLYLLKAVGLEDRTKYYTLVANTRESIEKSPRPLSVQMLPGELSFVTHRLLYESDYLRSHLDPALYPFELTYIRRALAALSDNSKVVRNNIDFLSQALFSLQLLQQKPNEKEIRLYTRLMSIQKADGSWSQQEGNVPFTFHNTAMATIALIQFSDDLRGRNGFCVNY